MWRYQEQESGCFCLISPLVMRKSNRPSCKLSLHQLRSMDLQRFHGNQKKPALYLKRKCAGRRTRPYDWLCQTFSFIQNVLTNTRFGGSRVFNLQSQTLSAMVKVSTK